MTMKFVLASPVVLIAQETTPFPGLCRLIRENQDFLVVM